MALNSFTEAIEGHSTAQELYDFEVFMLQKKIGKATKKWGCTMWRHISTEKNLEFHEVTSTFTEKINFTTKKKKNFTMRRHNFISKIPHAHCDVTR